MSLLFFKWFKKIFPPTLGILLIYYSYTNTTSFERIEIYSSMRSADYKFVLLSICLGILSHLSRSIRWQSMLKPLGYKIKILNSINSKYYSNRDKYNILYRSKIFLSETTLKFEFDRNSYTIVINTGLTFKSNETEIKNSPVSFKVLEDLFEKLIDNMERQLPKNRFETILEKMKVIANK